jgi:hypothetical protein
MEDFIEDFNRWKMLFIMTNYSLAKMTKTSKITSSKLTKMTNKICGKLITHYSLIDKDDKH